MSFNSIHISRIIELEDLIATPAFKLHPAIKVERPVNIPIPKAQSENGELGSGDKQSPGKKRKVSKTSAFSPIIFRSSSCVPS